MANKVNNMILLYLLILTNLSRSKPLTLNPTLTQYAQARAHYLCTHPFSHTGWKAFAPHNTSWIGENLATGYTDAVTAYQALLNSPTHRENIESSNFTQIGLAYECGVTVQLFSSDLPK